jgi:hypothetical protein
MKIEEAVVNEEMRIYYYTNGDHVKYANIVSLKVSESGNHYLKSSDGWLYVVAPGWRSISIKSPDWTV